MTSFLTTEILELSRHPHHNKKIQNPTHSGKLNNTLCGDNIAVELSVSNNIVYQAGFRAHGCNLVSASGSLLFDRILNKNINDIKKITPEFWVTTFKSLPQARESCVLLALQAVNNALFDK